MKSKIRIILIIVAIVLLDQIIKTNIIENFSETSLISIKNVFEIKNLSSAETAYALGENSIILLIIIDILIISVLAKVLIKNYKDLTESFKVGMALIIAAEISNLFDRIFRGYIVKFINVFKFGSFNLSDISMLCGILVLVVSFLILMVKKQEEEIQNK